PLTLYTISLHDALPIYAVIGAASHDTESLADSVGGLMMRGVHPQDEPVLRGSNAAELCSAGQPRAAVPTNNFCEQSVVGHLDRVRDRNRSSGFVIDLCSGGFRQEVGNVLDQRTLAIDVQTLQA